MSLLKRLFAPGRVPARAPAPSQLPRCNAASDLGARRDMLAVVLRDTLTRHGIPATWIACEILSVTSRAQRPGIHWRLLVKHWEPRLMTHGVALQHSLMKRLTTLDPTSGEWLTGISWQFALADESPCPRMPHPRSWIIDVPQVPADATPLAARGPGGAVSGLARLDDSDGSADAATRADLEKLFAVRDADFRQHADAADAPGHEGTQPMYLNTQPMQL